MNFGMKSWYGIGMPKMKRIVRKAYLAVFCAPDPVARVQRPRWRGKGSSLWLVARQGQAHHGVSRELLVAWMQGLVEHSLPCRLSADLAGPKHVLAAGRRLGWNSKPMATASVPTTILPACLDVLRFRF